jgi:hypothetical protein
VELDDYKIFKNTTHRQMCWGVAMEAVIVAGKRKPLARQPKNKMISKHKCHKPGRIRLGIPEVERQVMSKYVPTHLEEKHASPFDCKISTCQSFFPNDQPQAQHLAW